MSLMNYMRIKSSKNKKKNVLAGVFKATDNKQEDNQNGAGLKKRPIHIKLLQKPKEQKGYKKPTEAGKEQRRGALLNKGKHLKPADFYTRDYTVINKVVRIPPSTEKTLIIPPSYDGWSFLVDFYNPTFSPNITEEQFKSGIRTYD